MEVNPTIFRAYDIRGIVDKDLNPQIARLIGKAFGAYLLERGTKDVLVGRDLRESSPIYQREIISGLRSVGCNVFDLGVVLSPMLYFARQHYRIDGGVMVTASHNPPEWNGFKLCHGLNAIVGEEIEKVRDILLAEKFPISSGEGGTLVVREVVGPYVEAILKQVKLSRPLKVVVDCAYGTPSFFIPQFLSRLGCEVISFDCKPDPTFPRGVTDPANVSHYRALQERVKKEKADVGVLFDGGDGDRVGFVDGVGNVWLGDTILLLLLRDILPKHKGRKVIVEIKDSEAVVEETKRLGGIPIFWKTGHAFIDHKVFEEKAILAGEMSCHYWICDKWYYFDDALYALARVLQIIANSGKSLSALVADLPKYESTREYRIPCPEEKKVPLVEELVRYFWAKCDKAIDIDGIRGYLGDGWFLIRASNTQPLLVVRCEAKTKEGLERIKKFIKTKLDEYDYLRSFDWGE